MSIATCPCRRAHQVLILTTLKIVLTENFMTFSELKKQTVTVGDLLESIADYETACDVQGILMDKFGISRNKSIYITDAYLWSTDMPSDDTEVK